MKEFDDEWATGVELLQSGDAAVVGFQYEGFHLEIVVTVFEILTQHYIMIFF